jgi:hypothetical protein
VNLTVRSETGGQDYICGRGRALTSGPGVSATEGKSTLIERVQRERGNERLQGSEGVRTVRSRSDGGRGPRGSERVRDGSKGIRGGPRGSEPFDQDQTEGK